MIADRSSAYVCGYTALIVPEAYVHAGYRDDDPIGERETVAIAELMQALSAPSRLRLLFALRDGESGVGELADATGMTPSAASQQLRILRHLRFVATRRDGRAILYRLHDAHVAVLLAEARNHLEHATRGWTEPAPEIRGVT
jgi:DNA-binding transcriptional ArsR family regulator